MKLAGSANEFTRESLPMHWPVAFTGDAEVLCPDCALKRWGAWENGLNVAFDREGNEVRAVYSWEEGDHSCMNPRAHT